MAGHVARRRVYTLSEVSGGSYVTCLHHNDWRKRSAASQVAEHNAPQDCWVSILGDVFDITALVKVATACPVTCNFLEATSLVLCRLSRGLLLHLS